MAMLVRELPSEPSATSARWCPNGSPDDFMQRALAAIDQTRERLSMFRKMRIEPKTEAYNVREAERLFHEARYQLLTAKYGLTSLLDRSNWVSERPNVSLRATINQRGNFTLKWVPSGPALILTPDGALETLNTSGLRDGFFRRGIYQTEAYGNTRPPAELVRYRGVCLKYTEGSDHPSIRYVIYALRRRFDAIVDEVTKALDVVGDLPQMKLTQDDDTGLELTLT
jgi:hypothetical protein